MKMSYLFLLLCMLSPAAIAEPHYALQSDVDHVWTMMAAALVLFMQAGFLLLEAGQVRAKNAVNVAQKNLVDFSLSAVCFGLVGFAFMFGNSIDGWIGWDGGLAFFGGADPWTLTFFVFQLVFCGTAATVVSGAVAERMSMSGYIAITVLIAAVIYPVSGHWAWGGLLNDSEEPWLASKGFMDFAGSTVVHSVGAWVGLAAIMIIGPRSGKFDENGKPVVLHGHSPVLSTMGALILIVGWIGFNGGSTMAGSEGFASIVANTMIAGCVGGCTGFFIGRLHHGYNSPEFVINGLLSGLVAITAGCDVMTSQMAALVGIIGAAGAFTFREALERIAKLDDPLGAIAVHGAAGVIGTLLIAILAPTDTLLAGSRSTQFVVQLTGVASVFVWTFAVAYIVLRILHLLLPSPDGPGRGLRVSEHDEHIGLNVAEHNAPLGVFGLTKALAALVNEPDADVQKMVIDPGDETAEAAVLLNQLLDNLQKKRESEMENATSADEVQRYNAVLLETLSAYSKGDFERKISADETPHNLSDITRSLNGMASSVQNALSSVEKALGGFANGDLSVRILGSYDGVIGRMQTDVNASLSDVETIMKHIEAVVLAAGQGDFSKKVPVDEHQGYLRVLSDGMNQIGQIAQTGLDDISKTMSALTAGDLTARLSELQPGAFASIGEDIAEMAHTTESVIDRIARSANNVQETAASLTHTSTDLSNASTENRDLIENLNAELNALRQVIDNNEQRIQAAMVSSASARQAADDALEVSRATVEQMHLNHAAVQEIKESVNAIDTVARQTRLLSLNASVEASRASGDIGKGFAIIADEVRSLATVSGRNADEIKGRLGAVLDSIDRSVASVSRSDEALAVIHREVDNTESGILDLTQSGIQTIRAINSVERKVKAVSENTQKAAAGLQTAAHAAKSLQEDAASTQGEVAHFFASSDRKAA
ncbi:MAG: ammonium transporter [Granulosicoccus sp.]